MDPLATSLIESADAAVMVTDDRLAIVAWNGAMERLTGIQRRSAVGRPAAEALKFLGSADVAPYLERALRGESAATGEILYEIPDTRGRGWLSARYAPWRDTAGGVIGVIGTHVDVTARKRQADRLRELAEVEQLVGESLVLDDVLRRITDAGARLLGAPVVQVWTAEPAARVMRLQASSVAPGSADVRMPHQISYGEGIAGRVAAGKTAIYVDDVARDSRALSSEWARETGIQRMLSVPILSGEELLGVLAVRARDTSLAEEDNRALVTSLAARAAVAIQNARTYTVALRRAGRLRDLVAISQSISSSLDVKDVMQRITRAAAGLRPGALSTLHLLDAERGLLRAAALTGAEWEGLPAERPSHAGLPGLVVEAHAPVLVTKPNEHPQVVSRDWWSRRPNATYYGVPIDVGETFVGVLDFVAPEGAPDREEQEALRLLAAQAGVAIRNARLYQEAERRREGAEALARLGRELTGTLDVERMADHVTRTICEVLNVRGCVLFRHQPEDGTLHVVAAHGYEAAALRDVVLQPGEGIAGRAVAERKVVCTLDILADAGLVLSLERRERMVSLGYRSVVGIPLLARDHVVGALTLGDRAGRELTHEELQALQAFADQAALALESARLYETARESFERLRETQAQLVQAAKMSALGQLVSGVAHELNNPLSVIIGYGQLLLARDPPDALRRPIELMVAQGDRMAKIVRNLLYFARQRPPERIAVDLNQVLEQTLALRFNQLLLSGIRVQKEFSDELPLIAGDSSQLEQVFLNLLLNAEQAILEAKSEGVITLRTRGSDDGSLAIAEVIDDGPGISADLLARVFEPFFTTKTVGTGEGLGLSVSYGIVEEHGGRLTAQSEPGRTVFALELPATQPAPRTDAASGSRRRAIRGEGRVALVVEDEQPVRDLIATMLRDRGWQVDMADGGRAALDRVRARRYDLIVSDLKMAEGSGPEFYQHARAHDPMLAQRFIFITGDTANADLWAFLDGADVPVIEKPFHPALFEEAVWRLMSQPT